MDVTFADDDLDRLEVDPKAKTRLAPAIVRSYREHMNMIRRAEDERAFLAVVGPKNFYRLHGDRSHEHAFRLNGQWRLVIEIQKGDPKNRILVKRIEDYH